MEKKFFIGAMLILFFVVFTGCKSEVATQKSPDVVVEEVAETMKQIDDVKIKTTIDMDVENTTDNLKMNVVTSSALNNINNFSKLEGEVHNTIEIASGRSKAKKTRIDEFISSEKGKTKVYRGINDLWFYDDITDYGQTGIMFPSEVLSSYVDLSSEMKFEPDAKVDTVDCKVVSLKVSPDMLKQITNISDISVITGEAIDAFSDLTKIKLYIGKKDNYLYRAELDLSNLLKAAYDGQSIPTTKSTYIMNIEYFGFNEKNNIQIAQDAREGALSYEKSKEKVRMNLLADADVAATP